MAEGDALASGRLRLYHAAMAALGGGADGPDGPRGRDVLVGAVLAGGRSQRMGRDKALVPLGDGRPLSLVAASALRGAGCGRVVAVGGAPALAEHGLEVVADLHPGQGPLGGLLTALELVGDEPAGVVVVLTCDLPGVTSAEVSTLVSALQRTPDADVAAASTGGRPQYLTAAYRSTAARVLAAEFARGERAVRRAAPRLVTVEVAGLDPVRLQDVDTPDELAAYLAVRSGLPGT